MPEVTNNSATPQPPQVGWTFQADGAQQTPGAQALPPAPATGSVSWTASEYVSHDKGIAWFVLLGLAAIVLTGVIYLLTHDIISSSFIIVAAVIFGMFAARKPRELHYEINSSGIHIENKTYPFGLFKSFSVIDEGAFGAISLLPLKRFMPGLTVYYPPEQENKISTLLGDFLPLENHPVDLVDRFMKKIRF